MSRLKLMRYSAGLTIAQVVERTGISERTLYRLENGARPSPAAAKALADFYGVTVADLLGVAVA